MLKIYNRGDYVISRVRDFYDGTIWMVDWRHSHGYFCRGHFRLTRHDGRIFMGMGQMCYEPIFFNEADIEPVDPGLIAEAKLRGLKIPALI